MESRQVRDKYWITVQQEGKESAFQTQMFQKALIRLLLILRTLLRDHCLHLSSTFMHELAAEAFQLAFDSLISHLR